MSDKTDPKHVIIVIAYHGDAWIPKCLETLCQSTRQPLRILLVDNTGNDRLWNQPCEPHFLKVIETPRSMGFAEANNFALLHLPSDAETICFLNQDTISTHGWFDRCIQLLMAQPGMGAVTPLLRTYDDQGWDQSFLQIINKQQGYKDEWLSGNEDEMSLAYDVREMPATAMIVKAEVLSKVGPFDPVFGSYYEDFDLCLRILHADYRLAVCSNAKVRHFSGSVSQTQEAKRRRTRWILRNRTIYNLRKSNKPRYAVFLNLVVLEMLRQIIRSCLRTQSSHPISAVLRAVGDLIRLTPRLISESYDRKCWQYFLSTQVRE